MLGLVAIEVALLLLALTCIVGAIAVTAEVWQSEERLRTLLSYLLFLRSRRRIALGLFTAMLLASLVGLLMATVTTLLGWDTDIADVAAALAIAVAAGCFFLLAFYVLRERTLSGDDRAVLRAGHYSMYAQFSNEDPMPTAGPEELPVVYPGAPRPPRSA